jgi:plasmid stabilization system protein ParE
MTRIVRVRPEAEREIETAFAWYEEQRPGLGHEFLHELEVVYDRAVAFPLSHTHVYRGLRRARLRRFPVGVFYLVTEAEIRVVAVVHFARHPDVWRSRG